MIQLNVQTSELIIRCITIGIAYILTTTIAGYAKALVAYQLGDKGARDSGFLTLNPLVHINLAGVLCLFLLGVGWGNFIPINVHELKSRLHIALVFLTKPFVYIFSSCVSLISLVVLFGGKALNLIMVMVISDYVSLSALAQAYPHSSSFTLSVAMILIMIIYVGVMFSVLNLILDGFRAIQLVYVDRIPATPMNEALLFIVPFLALIFFAPILRALISQIIS